MADPIDIGYNEHSLTNQPNTATVGEKLTEPTIIMLMEYSADIKITPKLGTMCYCGEGVSTGTLF